ncbi:hypothetical protein GOP47_0012958 [Adiantum capillus-veneris]|uniref:Uncharacterized protein n=1 Tax=Adiantum capillus-veneris TaxID=13818 RepID=A0A9D4USS6_ADICA|nr:hypothetical protein GOP47_0012958 [Adiantum capillus-veneris]
MTLSALHSMELCHTASTSLRVRYKHTCHHLRNQNHKQLSCHLLQNPPWYIPLQKNLTTDTKTPVKQPPITHVSIASHKIAKSSIYLHLLHSQANLIPLQTCIQTLCKRHQGHLFILKNMTG